MAIEPGQFAVEAGASAVIGRGGAGAAAGEMALPRVGKRGAPQAFARKLFEILTTESQAVIAWNKQGNAFHVKDVETFSEETLTKYYRHSKFSSFQRQLNLYSFRKIVKGPDAGGYAHPMFRRDRPDDLYHVRRSISGSARYEPAARIATSASNKKAPSSASRRGGARANSKARASGWAPARAHKSNAAARRIGKLRSAPNTRRGVDHQSGSPGHATLGVGAAAASPAGGDVSSAGERSPWTSGESSDSDLVGGTSEGVSESDSEVEGEDKEEEQEQERGAGVLRHACEGALDNGTKRPSRDNRWFSRVGGGKEGATAADKAGRDEGVSGGRRAEGRLGAEGSTSAMVSSPTRRSPFNFFKKTFSFMEKSGSHNRGLSTASVDTGGVGAVGDDAAASSSSISSLMVDTSATARAAAAGVVADPSSSREAVTPVSVDGVPSAAAAGLNKPSPLLTISAPMTPKSSAEAAAALAEAAAAADAVAMPPPNPKRDQREELGLVEQLTNMVEVFDICDLLRKVSTSNSSRLDKPGGGGVPMKNSPQHLRNMSVDTDQGLPQSPQSRDGQSGLGSLASMELVRDSSKDWDTLMAGSADVSDLGNTMVQSVAEFFSF